MIRLINGQEAEWPDSVQRIWDSLELPEGIPVRANWFTARPEIDEFNRGSTEEGFLYTLILSGYSNDVRVVTRKVPKPAKPYIEPRGKW